MISDEERKERERLQEEADKEKAKIKPHKISVDGIEIDFEDRQTRLISKALSPSAQWNSGRSKLEDAKEEVCELFWRTKDGVYFVFLTDLDGEVMSRGIRIETKDAHSRMTWPHQWFVTEAQKKELQAEDFKLASARAARYAALDNKDV
ncbi:MAG: hypothetical protein WCE82_03365 [Halobacteriota archaeon]